MFRSLSGLQWVWFWFASSVVYLLQNRFAPAIFPVDGSAMKIIGGYFWSGLVVVFWTWIIRLIIKHVTKRKQGITPKVKPLEDAETKSDSGQ